jgi:hypothetical protein
MQSSIILNPARPDDDFKAQEKRLALATRADRGGLMRRNARVKLSREGVTRGLNGKRRSHQLRIEGTIISPLPVQQIVTVLWDGRTNPEGWHVDFLEKISAANEC